MTPPSGPDGAILEAREVVVRYGRGSRPALDGVTVAVPSGSLYCVIGPNGSGKSTLTRALLGTVPLESGSVLFEGTPISTWRRRALARSVAVVPQSETITFPVSVREMVAMGRYPHLGPFRGEARADREAIADALGECDVEQLASRDMAELSGGEVQLVRIARALAQKPRALVLDEPTANLDIRHEMEILGLLRRSADRGMTVLLVTHRLNVAARYADLLLLLNRGQVAAEGSVTEVLRKDLLDAVYEWTVGVGTDPVTGTLRVSPLDSPPRSSS